MDHGPMTLATTLPMLWTRLSVSRRRMAQALFLNSMVSNIQFVSCAEGAGVMMLFTGTYVNVNGGILLEDSAGPVPAASFAIDGGEPHIYTAPDSYNATWTNFLYSSGALANGPHALNITLLGSGSPWVFAFFLYNGTEEATTTTAAVVARQATVVDTITVAATPSEAAAAPAPAAPRADVPVGPIVGGVVGGVALLVCSAMAFYFLYWKRRGHGRGQERPYSYQRTEKADLFDAGALSALSILCSCTVLTETSRAFLQRTSGPRCMCTTTSAQRRRARPPSRSRRRPRGPIRRLLSRSPRSRPGFTRPPPSRIHHLRRVSPLRIPPLPLDFPSRNRHLRRGSPSRSLHPPHGFLSHNRRPRRGRTRTQTPRSGWSRTCPYPSWRSPAPRRRSSSGTTRGSGRTRTRRAPPASTPRRP